MRISGSPSGKSIFLVTCISTFLYFINVAVYNFSFPIFAVVSFHLSYSIVGLILSLRGILQLVLSVPSGRFIDRTDRKLSTLLGAGVILIAGVVGVMAQSQYDLVALQMLLGISNIFFMTTAMAIVANAAPNGERGRYLSLWQISMSIGMIIGPMVAGAVVDLYGLRSPFWFALTISIALTVLILVRMPSTKIHAEYAGTSLEREKTTTPIGNFLRNRRLLAVYFAGFASFLLEYGINRTLLPIYGNQIVGLEPTLVGLLASITSVVALLVFLPAGMLSDRLGRRVMLGTGMSFLCTACVAYMFSKSFITLIVPSVLFGLGSAVTGPSRISAIADFTKPKDRGTALGFYRAAMALAQLSAPLVGGYLLQYVSAEAAFGFPAITCLISAAILFIVLSK